MNEPQLTLWEALDQVIPAHRLARPNQPETAKEASESASRRAPSQRRRVWEALKQLGSATDYEISIHLGILRSSAAKRRQELSDQGFIVDTGQRRKTDTGTSAVVWRCSYSQHYSDSQ
jgi:hypothetical protein